MMNMTKVALNCLIASVTISGLLGILAILGGGGDLQFRILGTTSTISLSSLCCLSCAALWERKGRVFLPVSGVALTLAGAFFVIGGIWVQSNNEPILKLTLCLISFAVATSHLSLLSLANLSEAYRWSLVFAYAADYVLASLIAWLIVAGRDASPFELKFLGILSIAVASISILIPIFHRLSTNAVWEEDLRLSNDVLCPCCGTRREYAVGEMTCARCAGVFEIKVLGKTVNPTVAVRA